MSKLPWLRSLCLVFLFAPLVGAQTIDLPKQYDLRKVNGITPIKAQQGGTCWAHGTCAAIESNLLMKGTWKKVGGGAAYPAISEYHLDWWNGFNRHANRDLTDASKDPTGMTVHQGGDYRVSAAYISRGDGVLNLPRKEDNSFDLTWYKEIPQLQNPEFKKFYVRDIEWFTIGDNLERIDDIKRRIMTEGAMGTAYCASSTAPKGFLSKDFLHYQPQNTKQKPNHAVAIVGWDDDKTTTDENLKLPKPGAWLIKNSWGQKRGDQGFYWISYYDKVSCRDPEMGAVSFRNVEPMRYQHVYYHDYHGWRSTIGDINKACNVFTAAGKEDITAVSFYTCTDNVKYTCSIYTSFDKKGQLTGLRESVTGTIERTGFHTVDLTKAVRIEKGEKFIVCLEVDKGGMAIDRTSEIEVLLQPDTKQPEKKVDPQPEKKVDPQPQPKKKGGFGQPKGPRGPNNGPIVLSKANPEESFYYNGVIWRDLYEYRFDNPNWARFDRTANFCMKALTVDAK